MKILSSSINRILSKTVENQNTVQNKMQNSNNNDELVESIIKSVKNTFVSDNQDYSQFLDYEQYQNRRAKRSLDLEEL